MTQAPRVAFYAPMKSPRHPNPSGDRKIARLFVKALEQAGAEVEIASELRARDGAGNIDDQTHIRECGASEANTLIKRYQEYPAAAPTHWFTYHLYHKAPDWIGPAVSKSLDIPYIVAEASFAPKQAGGPWRMGHEQVATALGSAAAVVVLNPIDLVCVTPLLREECVTMEQPIWMDIKPDPGDRDATRQKISQDFGLDPALPWLVAVAMMRPGDKTSSFECLSRALEHGTSTSWQLLVVGDGETRPRVQGMFSNFADRTAFVGARTEQDVGAILRACDVMVWPAINEAIGMALLEAQANGLPVVAGNEGAVHTIVDSGRTGLLVPVGDDREFASGVSRLVNDASLRKRFSIAARQRAATHHSTNSAAKTLEQLLRDVQT